MASDRLPIDEAGFPSMTEWVTEPEATWLTKSFVGAATEKNACICTPEIRAITVNRVFHYF